jgi:hypothetical protein
MKKPVRLVAWVTPAQKAKVRKAAKAAKKLDEKSTDSSIIRGLIDSLKV